MRKLGIQQDFVKVGALAWAPDESRLACGFQNGNLCLLDAPVLGRPRGTYHLACLRQRQSIVFWLPRWHGGIDGKAKDRKIVLKGHARPVMVVAGGGGHLVTASATNDDAACRVWNLENGQLLGSLNEPADTTSRGAVALALSGTGKLAIAPGAGWNFYVTDAL